MKEIYADYFIKLITQEMDFKINMTDYKTIQDEIAREGKIDKLVEILQTYLSNLSNRDFIKFDEKYIKLMVYCIGMNLKSFRIKSEMEVERKYPDLLIVPRENNKNYGSVIIEFKYLKKGRCKPTRNKTKRSKRANRKICTIR